MPSIPAFHSAAAQPRRRPSALKRYLKQTVFVLGGGTAGILACQQGFADTLDGNTYVVTSTNISSNFGLDNVSGNTIDINGETATMSGTFTGAGGVTFIDSKGGGKLTLTGDSTFTGSTTIASGATLLLSGTGSIADSGNPSSASSTTSTTPVVTTPLTSLIVNGTFDISNTTSGAVIVSLAGTNSSATVNLGAEPLTLSNANDTFAGIITGTGEINLNAGSETLTNASTFTGLTTITSGSLILTGNGSIADSSSVTDGGVLDISGTTTSGVSLVSLSGGGRLNLGAQTLTLTNAAGAFSGVASGSGSIVVASGTEDLSGNNTFTGGVTVDSGATLELGSLTVAYNVANSGTVTFDTSSTVAMDGVISGSGAVSETASGVATITTVQTYTGATTITSGTLTLTGNGSIASSSSVTVDGALDVFGASGTTITSLSGSGIVELASGSLTISDGAGASATTPSIFTGTVYGPGSLIVAGGSQEFTASSTYSGATTVDSGAILLLPAGSSLQYSSVDDEGIVDISGVYSTNASYTTIGSLGGGGMVTLGPHNLFLAGAGDTFSGVISGAGGLTISAGTETLSGANTYTGVTTINAGAGLVLTSTGSLSTSGNVVDNGTLDISATVGPTSTFASLSGSGTINLGANTLHLTNASGDFSGTIQSSGGLTIGGGTEILEGNNSYTGGTTIDSGATLQLGFSSASGTVAGNVLDNGMLAFDRSDSSVFSGLISGTGTLLIQDGAGTTILTADNTFSGVTTIAAGTLQLGHGGTSGSLLDTSNVVDNGTLAFGRSDTMTFATVISGSGGVTQLSGETILTAANTYTGPTLIDNGATLALGGTGSISSSSGVTDNGTFDVSNVTAPAQITSLAGSSTGVVALGTQTLVITNAAGDFSGTVSGGGNITVSGGTQTLSGTNSYLGSTIVNGGTLLVNGSIASSSGVTVNSGGTLGGTGTVPSVTLASGGTLAPGAAGAGKLTVDGAVTFVSGGNFVVEQSSASYASLTTTGAETLGGTLSVSSTDGTYMLGTPMTVLTANGGRTGSFSVPATITGSNNAQFALTPTYGTDTVTLEIELAKLTPALPSNATTNQKNVVGGIDAAIAASTTPLPPAFENLGNLSRATLASDASQLTGEIGGDVPQMGTTLFTPFLNAMFDHVSDEYLGVASHRDAPPSYWLIGFGGSGNVNGAPATLGTQKLSSHLTGVVAGANWSLSPDFQLGGAVSAGFAKFRLADDGGTGKADAIQAGLYGFMQYSRHFYGSFALAFARDDVKTDRTLSVSGSDELTAKPTTTVYGGRYETGVELGWTTPYLAVQDVLSDVPAYSETASSGNSDIFALSYAGRTDNEASAEFGIRQAFDVEFTPRWILTPNGDLHLTDRLAWSHDLTNAPRTTAAFAALGSSSDFTVDHAVANKNAGLASVGAELKFDGGFSIAAQFDTTLSSNSQSYTGYAGVKYTW